MGLAPANGGFADRCVSYFTTRPGARNLWADKESNLGLSTYQIDVLPLNYPPKTICILPSLPLSYQFLLYINYFKT